MGQMREDLTKYPVYVFINGVLKRLERLDFWSSELQVHHFIRQSVRKNSPDFYKRVEHLQKLILMPAQMNYDLETMGEEGFLNKWKANKCDMVFSRKRWREGYYD